jgi:hypothetical protein
VAGSHLGKLRFCASLHLPFRPKETLSITPARNATKRWDFSWHRIALTEKKISHRCTLGEEEGLRRFARVPRLYNVRSNLNRLSVFCSARVSSPIALPSLLIPATMPTITINGNSLDPQGPRVQSLGLSQPTIEESNYILIQTTGPLTKTIKQELKQKQVVIQKKVSENTYLCGFKPTVSNIRTL